MPYILPYKNGSRSAKVLSESLGFKQVKRERSRFSALTRSGHPKKVINWGSSELPQHMQNTIIINEPDAVKTACNKLEAFRSLDGEVSIPEYSTEREDAVQWLQDGQKVVERHLLRGNSGRGIRIVDSVDDLQDAPLYVKYIKKTAEYRIHVFKGEAFDIQEKRRNRDVQDDQVNWQVRNTDGGFIFAREGIHLPDMPVEMVLEAEKAVQELGLDFGAVDVVWNNHYGKHYILEVNTACGLEGTTLDNYTKVFKEHYGLR